ncbi:MAG: N-acetyltransferase [Firmicutes bacterium]|nr:N-acetyltransferase [Bacillota bacterium]
MDKAVFRLMDEKERDYWYAYLLPEGFAPNEIKPRDDVERLLKEDRYEIWGLFPDDPQSLPAGFACLWKRPGIPLVLLDYLGVTGALRNGGWGARMLGWLKEQGRPLVLESEMPVADASEEENTIRRRRIAFYERNGFVPAYEMATCGMRWQAMLAGGEPYDPAYIMRWHKELYDEKRTDVKVPLGPNEVPELPYWMKLSDE